MLGLFLLHQNHFLGDRSWNLISIGYLILHVITQQVIVVATVQWITYQHVLKRHIRLMNNYLHTLRYSSLSFKESMLEIAENSYKLYNQIVRQADNLNKAYGWQMLFIVPLILIMLLYDIYLLSKIGVSHLEYSFHVIHEVVIGFFLLMLIVVPSYMTEQESKKFFRILRNIDMNIQEDPMFEEIVRF